MLPRTHLLSARQMSFKTDRTLVSSLESARYRGIRLPSLDEFDQGVKALGSHDGQVPSRTLMTSPHPNAARRAVVPLPSIEGRGSLVEYVAQANSTQMTASPHDHGGPFICAPRDHPSLSPGGKKRHNNQKYTTEEGDFIIYCVHDKKLKWKSTHRNFTNVFGTTDQRTYQGLRAWYYRMNQHVPLWDENGRLIFEHEEDLEPKHISIKRRERHDRPMGLAQRYPERAVGYRWVDEDIKRRCYDWGKPLAAFTGYICHISIY